jgi:hypothetical protein
MLRWWILVSLLVLGFSGAADAGRRGSLTAVPRDTLARQSQMKIRGRGLHTTATWNADRYHVHVRSRLDRLFNRHGLSGEAKNVLGPHDLPGNVQSVRFGADLQTVEVVEASSTRKPTNPRDFAIRQLQDSLLVLDSERFLIVDSVSRYEPDEDIQLHLAHFTIQAGRDGDQVIFNLTRRIAAGTEYQSEQGRFSPTFAVVNESSEGH